MRGRPKSRSGHEPGVKVDARSERWREHRKKVRAEIVDAAFRAIDHLGPDVSLREVIVIAPVLALLLVFGVYPKLMTTSIDPATKQVVEQVSPDHATTVVPATQVTAQAGSGG